MDKTWLFSARLRCCKAGTGALLFAAACFAAPAVAAIADRPAATPPAVFRGSDASSPQDAVTVLRGSPSRSAAAEQPPACPEGYYYAEGLGCVTPAAPGYAGAYPVAGAYDYGVPAFGEVVVVERRGFRRRAFLRRGRRPFAHAAAGRSLLAPPLRRRVARLRGTPRFGGPAGFRRAGAAARMRQR